MKKLSVMFFALLVAVTMNASKFAKVTSAPQDWSGQYLIAYNANGTAYVFNGMDASQDYQQVPIPANDTIESDALDDYVVEFAAMAGGVSFKRMVSGKYMFGTSGENSLKIGDVAVAHTIFFGTPDSVEIKCDGTFFVYNSTKNQERFRYFGKQPEYAPSTYKRLTLFKAVETIKPAEWTPDTLSVSEAIQLIDEKSPLKNKTHYIKGIVRDENYGTTWPGYAMMWLLDIDNDALQLEGYKIYKDAKGTKWQSKSDIPCGAGDTVLLFADGLDYYAQNKIYETTSGYFVEITGKAAPWTPDTLTVAEAIAVIRDSTRNEKGELLMNKSHFIKGVIEDQSYGTTWPGYAMMWLSDIDQPELQLKGYQIYKDKNSTKWENAEEIPCGLRDTVLLFADGLTYYAKDQIYETTSGYFVEIRGKSSTINANSIFKFGVGARLWGAAYDGERYKYELVFAKTEDNTEDALHMIINTTEEKGIAGNYQVRNYQGDSSYVDGEGPVEGSVMIQFVEDADATYNKYNVKADFTLNEQIYRIDTIFDLSGYDFDYIAQFKLSDDVPYVPQEGDTITCAQAKEYALNLLGDNETSNVNVFIIGYANNADKVSENQQTFYLDDQVAGTAKIVKSYWGNLTNMKQVTNGAKVLLHGKLMHYVNGSSHVAEIKNGDVVVLEGGEPLERDITLEPVPEGALTVAEAKALADQLAATDTSDVVIVMGYVTSLYNSYNTKYKSQSFYMNDVNDSASKSYFEAFQCGLEAPTIVGDFVWVEGRLTKFVKEDGDVNYNLVNGKGHFAALSTDLANVLQTLPQDKVRKVFLDGRIYIVHKGAIYNLQGAVIKK